MKALLFKLYKKNAVKVISMLTNNFPPGKVDLFRNGVCPWLDLDGEDLAIDAGDICRHKHGLVKNDLGHARRRNRLYIHLQLVALLRGLDYLGLMVRLARCRLVLSESGNKLGDGGERHDCYLEGIVNKVHLRVVVAEIGNHVTYTRVGRIVHRHHCKRGILPCHKIIARVPVYAH